MTGTKTFLSSIYLDANNWKKRTEKKDGCTIAIYEKGGYKIIYTGDRWLLNEKTIHYTDEVNV